MADKQAVFTLRVDTGNSVQDVQNFDQAVNSLNKDLKDTQKTASQQAGMDQFETKLKELDDRLKAGGLSMRDMTKLMKEYQTLAAQAGQTSPVGQQAIQNAGELKDTIGDLKAATTALASDTANLDAALQGIETGAAAFQGVQSAIALTGVESSALTETMIKLQATQGLVNAVTVVSKNLQKDTVLMLKLRQIQEKGVLATLTQNTIAQKANNMATIAASAVMKLFGGAVNQTSIGFKVLKGAIIATGIGAIAVVVGGLISKMGEWISSEKELKAAAEKRAAAYKDQQDAIEFQGELAQKQAELQGKTEVERLKMQRETAVKSQNLAQKEANEQYAIYSKLYDDDWGSINDETKAAYDRHVELQEDAKNKNRQIALLDKDIQLAIQREKVKNLSETNDQLNNQMKREISLMQAKGKDAFKLQVQDLKNRISQAAAGSDEQKNLQNELAILEINHNKEMTQKRKDQHDKRMQKLAKEREQIIGELKKLNDEQLALESERQKLMLELMADGREKELKQAEQNAEDFKTAFIDKRIQDEKDALDEQFKTGKITRAQYDKEIENLRVNALNKLSDKEKEVLTLRDDVLAKDRAAINKKYDDQAIADKQAAQDKLIELFLDQFDKEKLAAQKDAEDKTKILDEALKNGTISQFEYNIAKAKLVKDLADKEKQIEKDKNQAIKDEEQKRRDESLERAREMIEGAQEVLDKLNTINGLFNEIDNARLNAIKKNREDDLADIDAKMQAELNKENLSAEQKKAIEEKFAKQKYDIQKKAFDQEDKINRAKFNRDKALRLAQVGIDTASAIVKGIAEFGPPPSPAGIAAIASASIIGITQALAIANQQYQSGTAPTPPQLGSGATGGLTGAGASTFTANTNAQTTDLTGFQQGQGQNIPVSQVVVLESDITGTQNKVKLQEVKSSF